MVYLVVVYDLTASAFDMFAVWMCCDVRVSDLAPFATVPALYC